MDFSIENIITYSFVILIIGGALFYYVNKSKSKTKHSEDKIRIAKEYGLYEPVSLHPVVNPEICIGSGACIEACPEKDILGMVNGQAKTINASQCVGHGACFHACPVQAITLCIGTEKRGVELPHVSPEFESSLPGIFIAGELGGMGLIKNAVEQGKQACDFLTKKIKRPSTAEYDVIIIGAGPAGIAATLTAVKNKLKYLTLEQESLGGTVFNFPRSKIVMTSPMELPLYGKIKLAETFKSELLDLWNDVISQYNIKINEQEKVEEIKKSGEQFVVTTIKGKYSASSVLLAIGRRGTPRKLGVPGESKEKVSYRLLEPDLFYNKKILIVGGGDSAIESALMLANGDNEVTISYRNNTFARLKPKNLESINELEKSGRVKIIFNSNIKEIFDDKVILFHTEDNKEIELPNDLVYIFAGGELPIAFLEKTGIKITKKFGEAILKHN